MVPMSVAAGPYVAPLSPHAHRADALICVRQTSAGCLFACADHPVGEKRLRKERKKEVASPRNAPTTSEGAATVGSQAEAAHPREISSHREDRRCSHDSA